MCGIMSTAPRLDLVFAPADRVPRERLGGGCRDTAAAAACHTACGAEPLFDFIRPRCGEELRLSGRSSPRRWRLYVGRAALI